MQNLALLLVCKWMERLTSGNYTTEIWWSKNSVKSLWLHFHATCHDIILVNCGAPILGILNCFLTIIPALQSLRFLRRPHRNLLSIFFNKLIFQSIVCSVACIFLIILTILPLDLFCFRILRPNYTALWMFLSHDWSIIFCAAVYMQLNTPGEILEDENSMTKLHVSCKTNIEHESGSYVTFVSNQASVCGLFRYTAWSKYGMYIK